MSWSPSTKEMPEGMISRSRAKLEEQEVIGLEEDKETSQINAEKEECNCKRTKENPAEASLLLKRERAVNGTPQPPPSAS